MVPITENDLALFRERAKTELKSTGDIGRLAWDDVVEALCKEVARLRSGDCAKLREALENLYDQICHGETEQYVAANRQMIRAALSAPPRNCDVPEVAKDPWRAWLDDKSNWDEFGSPKLEIHDWLLAPATEKEGGAK